MLAGLFDVDFADTFLLTNDLDLVANFVAESDGARDSLDENERRRRVGSIHLHILNANQPIKKRLPRLQVLYAIQFQRVSYLAENAFRDFQPLGRQLVDFIFRLEKSRQRNKDRHDEPAKERAENVHAEVFPLR